jgi:hypothetical protein
MEDVFVHGAKHARIQSHIFLATSLLATVGFRFIAKIVARGYKHFLKGVAGVAGLREAMRFLMDKVHMVVGPLNPLGLECFAVIVLVYFGEPHEFIGKRVGQFEAKGVNIGAPMVIHKGQSIHGVRVGMQGIIKELIKGFIERVIDNGVIDNRGHFGIAG